MASTATFTIAEYEHMVACGAFSGPNGKPIELIRGELRMMSPQGTEHSELVSVLNDWSHAVSNRAVVRIRIQSSIVLPATKSQPEPDVVWAENKSYGKRLPQPPEIVLLVEVADSSLAYDLGEKCRLYCEAGIPEYWVVDIPNRSLHVFRVATADGYQIALQLQEDETVEPNAEPHATLKVAELFACLDAS